MSFPRLRGTDSTARVDPRRRLGARPSAALVLTAALVGALLLPAERAATAAEGPAPAPHTYDVIADVHTDAIATFWEKDQLVLGTLADTPAVHTRYDADAVWFHVGNASRVDELPAGREFIAPAGSTIWRTSETFQEGQLWAGFSTESVPVGTLDGDATTLTLVDVDGPGDVEVWQNDEESTAQRLWSSDEAAFRSFSRGRVHMHANWAFTAAGTYHLTVRADAAVNGAATSDTQTYTFVVGDLPEQVATTTTLTSSAAVLTTVEPVTFASQVVPAARGYVEYRAGAVVLGHAAVDDLGAASLVLPSLAIGTHAVTATFVPRSTNLARGSTSDPVGLTVLDESGAEFGVSGLRALYDVGDVLDVRVVGHGLADDEMYLWRLRPAGASGNGYSIYGDDWETASRGRLTQTIDVGLDGYELRVEVADATTWRATGAATAWFPIAVAAVDDVERVGTEFPAGAQYLGDDVVFPLSRALAPSETARVMIRWDGSPWYVLSGTSRVEGASVIARPSWTTGAAQFAVQILRDGVAVAQSPPVAGEVGTREILVHGLRGVYREGQTLDITAEIHPAKDGLLYEWSTLNEDNRLDVFQRGSGPDASSLELPMTTDWNGRTLYLQVVSVREGEEPVSVGYWNAALVVSDADPSEQLFFLENLSDHYHQGYSIDLQAVADPGLAEGDSITWEWLWPGADQWAELPGASGGSHRLTAEQALDGVQVRAALAFGDAGKTLTATPVTIHHDDHGSAARQKPTIAGMTRASAGETVTLVRELPANGPTVLTDHRWEKKIVGGEWTTVEGATAAQLSFPADAADDGAEYRVSILTPVGTVAYGPSPAVALQIQPSEPPATLRIDGAADRYTAGQVVSLSATQEPHTGSEDIRWFTRPSVDGEWIAIDGAAAATYQFIVHATQQIKAVAYGESGSVLAVSDPVTIVVEDAPAGAGVELAVSLRQSEEALVISVAAGSERSQLSDLTLNTRADRYVSEGEVGGITVTDTRSSSPGWSASGRVRELGTVDGAIIDGKHLGWTPKVLSGSATPGDSVSPGMTGGSGIKEWSLLGTAPAGSSTGTAVLGADLRIEAPTTTKVGDYAGRVLITVI